MLKGTTLYNCRDNFEVRYHVRYNHHRYELQHYAECKICGDRFYVNENDQVQVNGRVITRCDFNHPEQGIKNDS